MAEPTIPDEKRCTKCGECKKRSEFYQRSDGSSAGACKACTRKSEKERRSKSVIIQRTLESQKPSAQIRLDLGDPDVTRVVAKTCRLCKQLKPRNEFEQYALRTRWGMETTRYTFTCRACVASGPKDRRRPKTEKQCIYCKEIKLASEFHSHNYTTRTGKNSRRLMSACKECKGRYTKVWRIENKDHVEEVTRDWRERNKAQIVERNKAYNEFNKERMLNWGRKYWLRKGYGLTLEQYNEMVARQDGKCLICQDKPHLVGNKRQKTLHVDHCHDSGKIRGLLCHQCNCAIGLLKDDPARIRALLAYVETHAI
jgi:hypothetical protein